MKPCAVVTYIYPGSLSYLKDLVDSLNSQTYNNFDFIVFSDNVEQKEIEPINIQLSFFNVEGTPTEIRIKSFETLKVLNYSSYIFIDSHDTMTNNRVEITLDKLKKYDLVTCDLNLINYLGKTFEKQTWKNRLGTNFEFNHQFLRDKNIVGFGCTAVNKKILETPLQIKGSPIAADWFIFYQIIKLNYLTCLFTTECQVNYRQYENNEIGLKRITKERLKKISEVKDKHYNALKLIGIDEIKNNTNFEIENIELTNKNNLFWWEIPTKKIN